MKAIELSVKLYKYGEYRDTLKHSFDSMNELKEWVKDSIKESNYIRKSTPEEDCKKWEQEFEYNGKRYFLDIDL